jgi:hypothetical protein
VSAEHNIPQEREGSDINNNDDEYDGSDLFYKII